MHVRLQLMMLILPCEKDAADWLTRDLFVWLVAGGWCWFVLREKYCWLVAGGWFVLREKYCWLVADKPSEQADGWPLVLI
jgi:hypothetical protein